ncbi:IS3 family transposase [Pedobacter alluvionis]|uniref:Transposase n=1 Tax=Pedobacter alluvionis TaxID=475253 RepID=A0ABY2HPE3_9SPHI|nr:transposase [Pedobacter alluvionis]
MCRVFRVSNSSFYYWLKNPQGKRLIDDNHLMIEISKIYAESKGCYGSPRITAELCSRGIIISRPRVARLMRRLGIKSDSVLFWAHHPPLEERDRRSLDPSVKWENRSPPIRDVMYKVLF